MLKDSNAAGRQVVVFTLEGLRYALPLDRVQRVVRMVEVTPLPQAPRVVEGVINVEGEIIAVMNTRLRFGLPERHAALSDELLIAHARGRRVALHVDAVAGVAEYAESDIVAGEEVAPGARGLAGVARLADGLVLIHDLDGFLSGEEEQRLDEALHGA